MGRPCQCCENCNENIYEWNANTIDNGEVIEDITKLDKFYYLEKPLPKSHFYFTIQDPIPSGSITPNKNFKITYSLREGSKEGDEKFRFSIDYLLFFDPYFNRSSNQKIDTKVTLWTPEKEYSANCVFLNYDTGRFDRVPGKSLVTYYPTDYFTIIVRDKYINIFFKNAFFNARGTNKFLLNYEDSNIPEGFLDNPSSIWRLPLDLEGNDLILDTVNSLLIKKPEINNELYLSIKFESTNESDIIFHESSKWVLMTGNIPKPREGRPDINKDCFDIKECGLIKNSYKSPKWDFESDYIIPSFKDRLSYKYFASFNTDCSNEYRNVFNYNNNIEPGIIVCPTGISNRFVVGVIDGFFVYANFLGSPGPIIQQPSGNAYYKDNIEYAFCRFIVEPEVGEGYDENYYYLRGTVNYKFWLIGSTSGDGTDISFPVSSFSDTQIEQYFSGTWSNNPINISGALFPTKLFMSGIQSEPMEGTFPYFLMECSLTLDWLKKIEKWIGEPPEIVFKTTDDDFIGFNIGTIVQDPLSTDLISSKISSIDTSISRLKSFGPTGDMSIFAGDPIFRIDYYYIPLFAQCDYAVNTEEFKIRDIQFTLKPSDSDMPHPDE